MLTMNEDDETVLSAIRAGARLPAQGLGRGEVQPAVAAAAAGGMVFGASLARRVATYFVRRRPRRTPRPSPS